MVMPLSIILILLVCALIFHHKSPRFSFKCLLIGTLILLFSTFQPSANWVMRPIENSFPPFVNSAKKIDYIVMLGCYQVTDPRLSATSQLGECSLQRLVEGLRILKLHPEATLITSGASFNNSRSNAETMKQAAISLGVPKQKIMTENFPKDTEQEAQLIAPRIAGSHSVLITNADHMPRAMNYFHQYGASPIAAPIYTWVKNNNLPHTWHYLVPNPRALEQTTTAWYETLGRIVQWFKQRIS